MPDQSTKDLHIDIKVVIEQAGVNPRWGYVVDVPIPPAYTTDQELKAFLRHELDRAMTEFQREEFGYSRSADIIHQFDMRTRVIENLVKFAPFNQSRAALGAAIVAVLNLDTEELIARYQNARLED